MSVRLGGGCPCDAVRFEITEVFDAGYCHCNRCRKSTGAPVFAFVHVPRAAFSLVNGELVAEPWEHLGQGMICGSCRGCVYFDMGVRDLLSIGIGLLDEPARVRPTFHQCVSSKLPWLEIDDDLPRFNENTVTHPRERMSPICPPANVTLAPKSALARREAGESLSDIAHTFGVAARQG